MGRPGPSDSTNSRRRWLFASVILALPFLVILLSACGSEIADLEAILLDEPAVVDIGARSAAVVADTNIDVVCSVTYGTTTEYGQIATDLDMAGTGHSDHRALLRGLQPDTLYHYRLSGTGPDGTVYRSKDYTFRSASADRESSVPTTDENLASLSNGARIVGTSSVYGGGDDEGPWGGNSAIDGDDGTQWSSDGDGDAAWIEIELPAETLVTSVGLWSRTMGASAQIFSFRVVTDQGDIAGPFTIDDAGATYRFDTELRARWLRFEAVETSGGNTGAVEIEVFGVSPPR